jgi:hypothetical protein
MNQWYYTTAAATSHFLSTYLIGQLGRLNASDGLMVAEMQVKCELSNINNLRGFIRSVVSIQYPPIALLLYRTIIIVLFSIIGNCNKFQRLNKKCFHVLLKWPLLGCKQPIIQRHMHILNSWHLFILAEVQRYSKAC